MGRNACFSGTEKRSILTSAVNKRVSACLSYRCKGKKKLVKAILTRLGANVLEVEIVPRRNFRSLNIELDQQISVLFRDTYSRLVFECNLLGFDVDALSGQPQKMVLSIPDVIQMVERRRHFRVNVPASMDVKIELKRDKNKNEQSNDSDRIYHGRLVDISPGGIRLKFKLEDGPSLRKNQGVTITFTPMPYEESLSLKTVVRNITTTSSFDNVFVGLKIAELKNKSQDNSLLLRLYSISEYYHELNKATLETKGIVEVLSSDVRF
ncbi:MAG: PilZ domain-containing protein [Planctomycetes bacterium]|nr:PilZ domain-containing protein [Planctomycetota bacterium]MBL7107401.1 PilZ domain-containing protein [Phycisphaerae bacterium]